VDIAPHTRLAHLVKAPSLPVNSLHHQAVKDVAPGLTITAQAPDGIVEAVEAEGHPFALGVQWHPEELAVHDDRAQRLFAALVEACRGGT
jgi:putative glutamine amidotransferase